MAVSVFSLAAYLAYNSTYYSSHWLQNLLARSTNTAQDALIFGLMKGERTMVETLIRVHRPWMLVLAQRILSDGHLAEDCVQESLISIMHGIESFEGRSSFKALSLIHI